MAKKNSAQRLIDSSEKENFSKQKTKPQQRGSKEKISDDKKFIQDVKSKKIPKKILEMTPSLNLKTESDIAMDFATKAYKKFDRIIKSIALFGSSTKKTQGVGSDIDIVMIIDDAAIQWDQKLIAWYREELGKLISENPYKRSLHITTIKLTTWWEDLIRGDPVVLNVLRYGEPLIDFGGFFEPLKVLLFQGKIRPSPETIYNCLQRAPIHIQRSKAAELGAIEGLYWAMVDSAHAALISKGISPPSPEHISDNLYQTFVLKKQLDKKYVDWYQELLELHKNITHGKIRDLKGVEIDAWQKRTEEFLEVMAKLVKEIIG